jgi:hypothetical protein
LINVNITIYVDVRGLLLLLLLLVLLLHGAVA